MNQMEFALKHRFAMLFALPLKPLPDHVFLSRLKLMDPMYGTLQKWEEYMTAVKEAGNINLFNQTQRLISDKASLLIETSPSFREKKALVSKPKEKMRAVKAFCDVSTGDIYKDYYCGRRFLSLDIRSGSFYATRQLCEELQPFPNYESWLSQFTEKEIYLKAKNLRQIICSVGGGEIQSHILQSFMLDLLLDLHERRNSLAAHVLKINRDELIFDVSEYPCDTDYQKMLTGTLAEKHLSPVCIDMPLRLSVFTIQKAPVGVGYIETHTDGKQELKGVDLTHLPFILRELQNEPYQEEDFYFLHEKHVCKYMELPFEREE